MATIGIKVDTNFNEASKELKKFTGTTAAETKRINANLKKLEQFQANTFIQKNKRIALSVQATRGKTEALATEHRGLERKIQMLIRNGIDPLDNRLAALRGEYKRTAIAMKKTGTGTRNWGSALTTLTIAATAAYFALQKLLSVSSNLAEQTTKFNKVFESTTLDMGKVVEELRLKYALSTRAAREFLASNQDLLKPLGIIPNLAAKLSSEMVKLAADTASFNNQETEEVLRRMQSALVGQFRPMMKYGVVINQTILAQEAFRLGLAKTKAGITAAVKAQAAMRLMMKGLTDANKDMARTGGSYANQLKFMKARLEDFTASIGKTLLPVVTIMLGMFQKVLQLFLKIPGPIRDMIVVMTLLTGAFIVFKKVAIALGVVLKVALWKVLLVVAAAAAIITVIKNWDLFKEFLATFWEWFKVAGVFAIEFVKRALVGFFVVWQSGMQFVTNTLHSLGIISDETYLKMTRPFLKMADDFKKGGKELRNAAKIMGARWNKMGTVVGKIGNKVSNSIRKITGATRKMASSAIRNTQKVIDAFEKLNIKLMTEQNKRNRLVDFGLALRAELEKSNLTNRQMYIDGFNEVNIQKLREHLGYQLTLEVLQNSLLLAKKKEYFKAIVGLQRAQKKSDILEEEKKRDKILSYVGSTISGFSQIFAARANLISTQTKNQMENIESVFKKEIATGKLSNKEKDKLQKDFDKKKSAIEYSGAIRAWRLQRLSAIAAGAKAIINALGTTPFIPAGLIAAALAVSMTGIQLSNINASKPKLAAQMGLNFIVPENPRSSRGDNQNLRVNPGERVAITPRGEMARSTTINVMLDKRLLYSVVQEGFDNGEITLTNDNIVSYA